MKNTINAEEELMNLLSNELVKRIDAEILKNDNGMAIASNNVRKKSIEKIFKIKASV